MIVRLPVIVTSPVTVPPIFLFSAVFATSNAALACTKAPLAYSAADTPPALNALFAAMNAAFAYTPGEGLPEA